MHIKNNVIIIFLFSFIFFRILVRILGPFFEMKNQTQKRGVPKEKGHRIFKKMGHQISLKAIQ